MGVKLATLYLVSIASPLFAAHQIAPSMNAVLSNENAKSAIISRQVVNRPLKSDRLPIRQVTPASELLREHFKPPAQLMPNRKNDTNCKPPIDVRGRCFA